jgi:two-component system sensor histidine kinase/response regulator
MAKSVLAPRDPGVNRNLKKEISRLLKANESLREADQLRGDLLAMVVHDLKGPLSAVFANLSILEQEPLSPAQNRYLGMAIQGAEEFHRRIQNTLEVGWLEKGRKEIHPVFFDPLEAIQGVINGLMRMADMRGVLITIHKGKGAHSLFADKQLFMDTTRNLVINGLERAPSGSEVKIGLEWSPGLDNLQVGVADKGPVIGKSDRRRLFQKDFTLRYGKRPGLAGLGLAFCKLAVEAQGGRIWIDGGNGHAYRFLFSIPNTLPK